MPIVETPLSNFNQKLIYQTHKYPQCSCGNCPKFFCNIISCASRGQGKTYSMCQMIKHWEDNKIIDEDGNRRQLRTWLISPTVQANQVWTSLKSLDEDDIRDDYDDNTLKDIISEIKTTKKECEEYLKYCNAYKKYSKLDEYQLHKLTNDELCCLSKYNFMEPEFVPHNERFEYPPVNIIILDDMLGSECFNQKRTSYFQKQIIQNRHHQICYAILIQNLKSIPKAIRQNSNVFWLGKFSNIVKVVEDIYEEVSASMTEAEFIEMYLHAIDKEYGSFVIDLSHKKPRFLINWDTEITYSKN